MTNHQMMIAPLIAALFIVAAPPILFASELVPGQSSEKAVESGEGIKKRFPGRVSHDRFSGRVLEVKEDHVKVSLAKLKEERTIHLQPSLLPILGKISDQTYTMSTRERRLPSGLTGAMALHDQRGCMLFWNPFEIGHCSRLKNAMVYRWSRNQVGSEPSSTSRCAIVYNIPTVFIIGDQRFILKAFENKRVTIGGYLHSVPPDKPLDHGKTVPGSL